MFSADQFWYHILSDCYDALNRDRAGVWAIWLATLSQAKSVSQEVFEDFFPSVGS